MASSKYCRNIALLLTLFVSASHASAETGISAKGNRQVLEHALKGLEELEKREFDVEGKLLFESVSLNGQRLPSNARPALLREITFKRGGAGYLNESGTLNNGVVEQRAVTVGSEAYSFDVAKSSNSSPWLLGRLEATNGAVIPRQSIREIGFLRYIEAPWSLLGLPISKILQDKSCEVMEVRPLADAERKFHFEFQCKSPAFVSTPGVEWKSLKGNFTLDSDNLWRLNDYSVNADIVVTAAKKEIPLWAEGRVTYGDIDVALPAQVVQLRGDPKGEEGEQTTISVVDLKKRTIAADELSLSSFELEEPLSLEDSTKYGKTNWLIYANIVLVLAVLMGIAWKYRRRQSDV